MVSFVKCVISIKRKHCITVWFAHLAVESVHQIYRVRVAIDSLQHEAYNEIYGFDAFCDH